MSTYEFIRPNHVQALKLLKTGPVRGIAFDTHPPSWYYQAIDEGLLDPQLLCFGPDRDTWIVHIYHTDSPTYDTVLSGDYLVYYGNNTFERLSAEDFNEKFRKVT